MEWATSFQVTGVKELPESFFSVGLAQPARVPATSKVERSRARGFFSIFFIITSK